MDPASRIPGDPAALERFIHERELQCGNVKEEARAGIIWADPETKKRTSLSLVYLHGFKASHGEGRPVHTTIAEKFGLNLYLSRLKGHGRTIRKPFQHLSPENFIQSAEFALQVGMKLGERVLIMGTSTGASLALYLASMDKYRDTIAGIILYSPLIRFYGWQKFLEYHWSRSLLQILPGKDHVVQARAETKESKKIWYDEYRLQGALALGALIKNKMTVATFNSVRCPVFAGYYYKNPLQRDRVISIRSIKKMIPLLGTPGSEIRLVNFPNAGTHVIASELYSGSIDAIISETAQFLEHFDINHVTSIGTVENI